MFERKIREVKEEGVQPVISENIPDYTEELKEDIVRKDKRINELEKENKKLKQILTLFHNPHTPPSKQRIKTLRLTWIKIQK